MADPVELMLIQTMNRLPQHQRLELQMSYMGQRKDRTTALILSVLIGEFGIDRFYLGHVGLGLGKLLTVGGCGLWWLVDLFLIMGAADQHNREVLMRLEAAYALPSGPMPGPGPYLPLPAGGGAYGPPPGYGPPPRGM